MHWAFHLFYEQFINSTFLYMLPWGSDFDSFKIEFPTVMHMLHAKSVKNNDSLGTVG